MKKNINEILMTLTPDTPLEEFIAYCDTIEDFNLILAKLPNIESRPVPLSNEIKESARKLIFESGHHESDLTTAYIQRNLPVTYPQAAVLVDWLTSLLAIRKS